MTIFHGIECQTTKMNITFSMGNGLPNMPLQIFPETPPYRLNDSQKTSFGAHFPPYQWFYWNNCFQNKNK